MFARSTEGGFREKGKARRTATDNSVGGEPLLLPLERQHGDGNVNGRAPDHPQLVGGDVGFGRPGLPVGDQYDIALLQGDGVVLASRPEGRAIALVGSDHDVTTNDDGLPLQRIGATEAGQQENENEQIAHERLLF